MALEEQMECNIVLAEQQPTIANDIRVIHIIQVINLKVTYKFTSLEFSIFYRPIVC